MRIEVISTGNELLDGTTADTNLLRLANFLRPYGLRVARSTLVPDSKLEMFEVIEGAKSRSDLLIVSGGLGPTEDDLTLAVFAEAFGSELVYDKKAEKVILDRLKELKRVKVNSSNLKQAYIPKGSKALSNKMGTAPAVRWDLKELTIFFLPGVPREYQYVLDRHIGSWLDKKFKSPNGQHLFELRVFGVPESELNEYLKNLKIPRGVDLGFRTRFPENHLKIVAEGKSREAARRKAMPLIRKIRDILKKRIYTEDQVSFEEVKVNELIRLKVKVAVAESCTGGKVASMITNVPGSSSVLDRGFVTYSNEAKVEQLGVNAATLKKFGAVSEETAIEMAKGALKHSNASRAVAITGIAGPGGGTRSKPVGTVWIAYASAKRIQTRLLTMGLSREWNRELSAYVALEMLVDPDSK